MTNVRDDHTVVEALELGLLESPVMAVFRGLSPADTVRLAHRAWDIGCAHVEVPIESAVAIPSLCAAIAAGRERGKVVGAGTIVDADQLHEVAGLGAAYLVSPGLDPTIVALAAERGLPLLPGVATPSELLLARRLGFRWVKAFPASVLGTGWFSAMRGPFPTMNIVATGGMDAGNAGAFLAAGARVVGVGTALADDRQLSILESLVSSTTT